MPPAAANRRVTARVKAKPAPRPASSTARQGAAFGTRAPKALPQPPRRSTPKFHPVPTPDQSMGRPTEPTSVTVRARHKGGRIVRTQHVVPDVAHAQAHLDRVAQAAEWRKNLRDEQRTQHDRILDPKDVPRSQKAFDDRKARGDRVIRATVRAGVKKMRVQDEKELRLAGATEGVNSKGQSRYNRALDREAQRLTPAVHAAAAKLPEDDKRELHEAAVTAARSQNRDPKNFTQRLRDEPAQNTNAIGAVLGEAQRRELQRSTQHKLEHGDAGDVLGNISRGTVGVAKNLPAAGVELFKTGMEQQAIHDGMKHPHRDALVKGSLASPVGELAQGAVSVARGHGTDKHFRKSWRGARLDPVGSVLTFVPAVGAAAKGAEFASVASKVARAGKAAREGQTIRATVKQTVGTRRIRQNVVVDHARTPARNVSVAGTRKERAGLRTGTAKHRTGTVATQLRVYAKNPIYRAVQRGREDWKAHRGVDPHQAGHRGGPLSHATRVLIRDKGLRYAVTKKAGEVREAHAQAGVTDEMAAGGGPSRRTVRVTERKAVKGTRRVPSPARKAEREARSALFAHVEAGPVKDAKTLDKVINTYKQTIATGRDGKHVLTPDELAEAQTNLGHLEHARTLGLIDDANIHVAAGHRKDVMTGAGRRREPRVPGGAAAMRGREEKVIREMRTPVAGGGAPLPGEAGHVPEGMHWDDHTDDWVPDAGHVAPADVTHSEPLRPKVSFRRSDASDPGFQFRSGESTSSLRERHAQVLADVDRLESTLAPRGRPLDPARRVSVSDRDPRGQRVLAENRDAARRLSALRDERDALEPIIAARERHLAANPEAVERPSPQRPRGRTAASIKRINAAKAKLDGLLAHVSTRRAYRDASEKHSQAFEEAQRNLFAAHRHDHVVLGHALHPDDLSFDQATWMKRYDAKGKPVPYEHQGLLDDRAALENWTGESAPKTVDGARALEDHARNLRARRASGDSPEAERVAGTPGSVVTHAATVARAEQKLKGIKSLIVQAEKDLDRIRARRDKQHQIGGERGHGRTTWEADETDLEHELAGLKARRRDLEQTISDAPDHAISDEELRGLQRAGSRLAEHLDHFHSMQMRRRTRARKAGERADTFAKVVRGSRVDDVPDDLDAQVAAARAEYDAAIRADAPVQMHADAAARQVVRAAVRGEHAGTSMHGDPLVPTASLEARAADLGTERTLAARQRPARPDPGFGPGGGPTEGLGAGRAAARPAAPAAEPGAGVPLKVRVPGANPAYGGLSAPPRGKLRPVSGVKRKRTPPRGQPGARTLPQDLSSLFREEKANQVSQGPKAPQAPQTPRTRPQRAPEPARVEAMQAGRQPTVEPAVETPRERKTRLQRDRRAKARAQRNAPPLKVRVKQMTEARKANPPQGKPTPTRANPVLADVMPRSAREGSVGDVQPATPKPPPEPHPGTRASDAKVPDRGSFVPTEQELKKSDGRLGVSDIHGHWTKTKLMSNPWGKYDPAEAHSRLERGISADAVRRELLQSAEGHITNLTETQAADRVNVLNGKKTGVKWAAVQTKDGDASFAVMPKPLVQRWHASQKEPGLFNRGLRYANTRFVRSVLPLSATWHMGNATDMMTRLALSGAQPGDAALARELRKNLADVNPDLATHILDSIRGAHFTGQDAERQKIVAHIPAVGKAADRLLSAGGLLDKAFAAGKAVERKGAQSAQGTAFRQQAKALGMEHADVQTMVKHWQDRPELVEDFQRRTLEIVGDYVNSPMLFGKDLRVAAPFIQWIKASLKFTFHTLPAKHPLKVALMMNLSQATQEQRRLIGADSMLSPEDAKAMGLPAPASGFLAGGIKTPGDAMIPTGNLTSFSSASEAVSDPAQYFGNILFPWAAGPAGRALGSRDSAPEYGLRTAWRVVARDKNPLAPGKGRDTGDPGSGRALLEGLSAAGDAFTPGYQLTAKVRRGGRRPGLHTTSLGSIRFGGQKRPNVLSADKKHVLKEGSYRDSSTGKTYKGAQGAVRVLGGPMFSPQKDFPKDRPRPASGPGGTIVQVKALDGSYYQFDTRTGTVVPTAARPRAVR